MRYFLILITLVYVSAVGQTVDKFELPNMVVPSPHAAGLSNFGNINVNENSGTIAPQISIPAYQVGNISVPISLAYQGNGVKVEDAPNWTGMNWNLHAGGVITRLVKDLPDETSKPSLYYTKEFLVSQLGEWHMGLGVPYQMLPPEIISNIVFNINNDSESDVFTFSFCGKSGSFFIVKDSIGNLSVKPSNVAEEMRIEVVGDFYQDDFTDYGSTMQTQSSYTFLITDSQGVKYFFGGLISGSNHYAYEETQLSETSSDPSLKAGLRAKTAFYLTRIEAPQGDVVLFDYENTPKYQTLSTRTQRIATVLPPHHPPCDEAVGIAFSVSDYSTIPQIIYNNVYFGKHLKRIYSPQYPGFVEVKEATVFTTGQGGINSLKYKVLKSVEVNNTKILFKYNKPIADIESQKPDRFFLTGLEFFNQGEDDFYAYEFEYNDLNALPNRASFAQDYLGYYNGKVDNPSLLPKNSIKYFINMSGDFLTLFPAAYNTVYFWPILNSFGFTHVDDNILGDREPSFSHATKGVLKKITYPTGGYTTFDYEPIDLKPLEETRSLSIQRGSTLSQAVLEDTTIIGSGEVEGPINPFPTQTVEGLLQITWGGDLSSNLKFDYVYVIITDIQSQSVRVEKVHLPLDVLSPFYTGPETFTKKFLFQINEGRNYSVKLAFSSNLFNNETPPIPYSAITYSSLSDISGSFSFSFVSGLDVNDGAGIRIRRVSDYSHPDTPPSRKEVLL